MDDYFIKIQKPLSIVALFAGIVQISGIAVLPHIKLEYQSQLIWFLISFPVLMVLLFFITINFYIRAHSRRNDLLFYPKSGRKFKPVTRYEIDRIRQDITNSDTKPKNLTDSQPFTQKISKTLTRNEASEQTGEKYRRVETAAGEKITWK